MSLPQAKLSTAGDREWSAYISGRKEKKPQIGGRELSRGQAGPRVRSPGAGPPSRGCTGLRRPRGACSGRGGGTRRARGSAAADWWTPWRRRHAGARSARLYFFAWELFSALFRSTLPACIAVSRSGPFLRRTPPHPRGGGGVQPSQGLGASRSLLPAPGPPSPHQASK